MADQLQRVEGTGGATARGQHPLHDGGRLRTSHVLHVRRRPHGRAAGQVSPLRLGQPALPPTTTASSSARAMPARCSTPCSRPPAPSPTRSCCRLRKFGSRFRAIPTRTSCPSRCRHRLARPGPAHRRRHGAERQVPRQAALPRLGRPRRQRDGRRLHLGGVRQGVLLQARQPDRHPRHEPPRPARRDRPRLEQRRLRRPRPRLRLARHRAGRPRPRRHRPRLRRGG